MSGASTPGDGNFGKDDVLVCPRCGGRMTVSRRTPSPDFGPDFEHQTFHCAECSNEIGRDVDREGLARPLA
jgi:DNA-directed RNA polymerase subunit RPC12/RpoP